MAEGPKGRDQKGDAGGAGSKSGAMPRLEAIRKAAAEGRPEAPKPTGQAPRAERTQRLLQEAGAVRAEGQIAMPERPAGMRLSTKFGIALTLVTAAALAVYTVALMRTTLDEFSRQIDGQGAQLSMYLALPGWEYWQGRIEPTELTFGELTAEEVRELEEQGYTPPSNFSVVMYGGRSRAEALDVLNGILSDIYDRTRGGTNYNNLIASKITDLQRRLDESAVAKEPLDEIDVRAIRYRPGSPSVVENVFIAQPSGFLNTTGGGETTVRAKVKAIDGRLEYSLPHTFMAVSGDPSTATPVEIAEGTLEGKPVRLYSAPLLDESGSRVADAVVVMNVHRLNDLKASFIQRASVAIVLAVLLAAGMAYLVGRRVTEPVNLLLRDITAVAQGDLDHQTAAHSTDEIGLLARAFNQMTRSLSAAQKAEVERKALEHELSIATEIQQKLLPDEKPEIAGLDIEAFYRPSKEVGGDYYDYVDVAKTHTGFMVADVSGKGIPGSMVMAMTRSLVRMAGSGSGSPAAVLTEVNNTLARDIKRGMFVTAFYAILDHRKLTLRVCSAGHNPMILVRGGKVMEINPKGLALGIDRKGRFAKMVRDKAFQLKPGDRVLLYTDGVPEAMNADDEQFSDERLLEEAAGWDGMTSREVIDDLVGKLDAFKGSAPQHDDITILTFRVLEGE